LPHFQDPRTLLTFTLKSPTGSFFSLPKCTVYISDKRKQSYVPILVILLPEGQAAESWKSSTK